MSNKAHQSAYIATAIKKRRRNKNSPNKTKPRCLFISATFVFAALALTLEARAHAERSHASAFANKYETNLTAEVKSNFLPCWAAIGNVYSNSTTHSHVLARACILVTRGRGRTDLRKLILLLLLIGGIELNPGPPMQCKICDRHGRKNAIRMTCSECLRWSHAVCLKLTEPEKKKYRQSGYTCYQCSLPATLSDSFLSLEPPLALNESSESMEINAKDENKNTTKLLCFNARSLKNAKTGADIAAFMQTHSADIAGINETWLKKGMHDHEFISNSYMVFRKDREKGRAGGVLLAIRPHLQPKRVQELELPNTEIVWVKIKADKMTILIGSAYRAPNLSSKENKEFISALNLGTSKMHEYDGVILMGDFNLDVNWAPDTPIARKAPAAEFLSEFTDIGLTQLIKGPTRTTENSEKTLDLLLTDVPGIFTGTEVVAGVSDHDALVANLTLNVVRPTRPPKTVFNFNRANWDELKLDFARRLPQEFPDMDINSAWEQWKFIFFDCLQKNVPTKSIKGKEKSLPWIDKGLRKMIAKRDKLFSIWHKVRTADARGLFIEARKEVQRALRSAKDAYMWTLIWALAQRDQISFGAT
jgi:Endonuclease-reverse transcriptase